MKCRGVVVPFRCLLKVEVPAVATATVAAEMGNPAKAVKVAVTNRWPSGKGPLS